MLDHDHNDVPPRGDGGEPPDGNEASGFVPTLGDRLRDLGADPRVAVAVLAAVVLVVGVLWYRSGSSDPTGASTGSSSEGTPNDATSSPSAVATTTAPGEAEEVSDDGAGSPEPTGDIVVHVAGAVTSPGVVRIPPGSRVGDAVEAAGGAVGDADLDRLNLAAVVEDGQRILVARRGDPPSASSGLSDVSGENGDVGDSTSDGDGDTEGLVNLNEADTEDLEELPGIGPVLAEAIVDERESRGGFRSVNELRDVRGIGEKRFEDLRDRVTL